MWPVAGSLLIIDNRLVVAAGRQNESDGGIFLSILDPATGALLSERRIDNSPSSAGSPSSKPNNVSAFTTDIMSSDGRLAFITSAAIHPPTAHWVNSLRDGGYGQNGKLHPFPPPVTGFGEDYWGMHLSQAKTHIISRNTGARIEAKRGDGWTYGATTTYGGPLSHRWVVRNRTLYGSGWSGTLVKLALDEQGRPIDASNNPKATWLRAGCRNRSHQCRVCRRLRLRA